MPLRQPATVLGPSVRAIFFDAVGTLLFPDPPASAVYATVGRKYGSRLSPEAIAGRFRAAFEREEEFDRRQGLRTSEPREFERWRHIVGRVLDDVADPVACFRELFEWFSRPAAWCSPAYAGPTLAELSRRGYTLGLASNYDSRLRSVAAGWPVLRPLTHLVISSEVGWRKPAPEFFAALVRAVGLPADSVLYVGDDLANDYEGGRAAGLRTILCAPDGEEPASGLARIHRLADLVGPVE